MRKILILISIVLLGMGVYAQPLNYYDGTEGLTATALKSTLHTIIDGHVKYHYSTVKQILKNSDEDPNNPDNIILLYTGWSIPKANFASVVDSLDYWNREHVWAKSHGDFGTDPGPGTDAHALRPVDNSVNTKRSYKDFDNGGTEVFDNGIPTGCYTDNNSWEPRNDVKGDVARMIFYMATRYEGTNGELDLEVVDAVGTYPAPEHGKLSTLLAWNLADPPDEFEKNRNDVVFNWQKNRNPFVDYPEFAEIIWNGATPSDIFISNVTSNPAQPEADDTVTINANIIHNTGGTITGATLYWGLSWGDLSNQVSLTASGSNYSGQIPGQAASTKVYFKIIVNSGTEQKTYYGSYTVANEPFSGTLTSIYDIQGQAAASPYNNQTVSTKGVVTASFGADFFIQNGNGPWSGIFVYNSGYFPQTGDSVIVTALVQEYYDMTELTNLSAFYPLSSNNPLPDPIVLATGDVWDEQYESVLVRVEDAQCVRDTAFGMWIVNDGTGDCLIHNSAVYSFNYTIGNFYSITGPLKFDFDEFKIELRGADDVEAGVDSKAPSVNNIQLFSQTIMHINFSEVVEQGSAEDLANYQIDNGISVVSAAQHAFDKTKVILTLSPLSVGDYVLTVNAVQDLAGNAMTAQQIEFSSPYSIDENSLGQWQIYPNPVEDYLYIESENQNLKEVAIHIFDFTGRLVKQFSKNNSALISVDVSNLNEGMYFIEIQSGDKVGTTKFVKLK